MSQVRVQLCSVLCCKFETVLFHSHNVIPSQTQTFKAVHNPIVRIAHIQQIPTPRDMHTKNCSNKVQRVTNQAKSKPNFPLPALISPLM